MITGEVKNIKQQFKENEFVINYTGDYNFQHNELFDIKEHGENEITLQLHNAVSHNALLKYFIEKNCEINSFNEILPSLNQIFIKLVKENNRA